MPFAVLVADERQVVDRAITFEPKHAQCKQKSLPWNIKLGIIVSAISKAMSVYSMLLAAEDQLLAVNWKQSRNSRCALYTSKFPKI